MYSNCLYCGKRLGFFHSRKKPYCSDVHEDRYLEREAQSGLSRLKDEYPLTTFHTLEEIKSAAAKPYVYPDLDPIDYEELESPTGQKMLPAPLAAFDPLHLSIPPPLETAPSKPPEPEDQQTAPQSVELTAIVKEMAPWLGPALEDFRPAMPEAGPRAAIANALALEFVQHAPLPGEVLLLETAGVTLAPVDDLPQPEPPAPAAAPEPQLQGPRNLRMFPARAPGAEVAPELEAEWPRRPSVMIPYTSGNRPMSWPAVEPNQEAPRPTAPLPFGLRKLEAHAIRLQETLPQKTFCDWSIELQIAQPDIALEARSLPLFGPLEVPSLRPADDFSIEPLLPQPEPIYLRGFRQMKGPELPAVGRRFRSLATVGASLAWRAVGSELERFRPEPIRKRPELVLPEVG